MKKKQLKLSEAQKRLVRDVIEKNRALGGSSWKDYTREEIIAIYGELPYWAESFEESEWVGKQRGLKR